MESLNDNINEILGLHFSGEKLTDAQEKALLDWVCEHKAEYNRISKLFQSVQSSAGLTIDTDKAWNKVEDKLSRPKSFSFKLVRRYFSYAACIVVLLGISLFYLNRSGDPSNLYENTTDGLLTVVLPDSSAVTLYPKSRVSYLADAKKQERITEMEGKAFFKVKRNVEKPFIVHNQNVAIRVLGTSFLVDGDDLSETGIFVKEGIVQVSTEKVKVILKANEQALSQCGEIVKSSIDDAESVFENHVRQKVYKNVSLSQVVQDIEAEFGVQIVLEASVQNNRISTKIKFENIEDILSEISYICDIEFRKLSDTKYEFYKLR